MINTSIGYHTLTISLKLTWEDAELLYKRFEECTDTAIIPYGKNKSYLSEDKFVRNLQVQNTKFHKIIYPNQSKGIHWTLIKSSHTPAYMAQHHTDNDKPCSIQATINPKIFTGIVDYVTAADATYIDETKRRFDIEAARISSVLGSFDSYSINRIDYCVNFDLQELGINLSQDRNINRERMMELIRRADIPPQYHELMERDEKSHRLKPPDGSFYLKNNSANINIYDKHFHIEREFANCPNTDDSLDVIRFEVQYKYLKIYRMTKSTNGKIPLSELLSRLLSPTACSDIINNYFDKIITRGDYYTLDMARRIIENQDYHPKKEQRLIDCLTLINQRRSVAKTKSELQGEQSAEFSRSLRELKNLNINPVTIPREWGVKYVPCLMSAYYRQLSLEQSKQDLELIGQEILNDYFSKKKK